MARTPAHDSEQVVVDWRVVYMGAGIAGAFFVGLAITLTLMAVYGRREAPEVPVAEAPAVNRHLAILPPVEDVPLQLEFVPPPPPPPPEPPRAKVAKKAPPKAEDSLTRATGQVAAPTPVFPPPFPRMNDTTEEELRTWLRENVPELASKTVEDATATLLKKAKVDGRRRVRRLTAAERNEKGKEEDAKPLKHPMLNAMARAPELTGIRFVGAEECRTERQKAERIAEYAAAVRRTERQRSSTSHPIAYAYRYQLNDQYKRWEKPEATSTLVQVLQPELEVDRFGLASALKEIKGPEASVALARRAVFDLSPVVREAAAAALKERPAVEYRHELVQGLRHPWSAAANHAAEALAFLGDDLVVPELVALLDEPPPGQPFKSKEGHWVARQLVRVNHLRNCLMCHAESQSEFDPLRGRVPVPGEPVPEGEVYYGGSGGFVRADVVYLRQDFSVVQPVARSSSDPYEDPWPALQRFDYVVRDKPLSEDECKDLEKKKATASYPQREAVLFALRGLTGVDAGSSASDWEATLLEHGFLPRKK
jgi:hypothetical protein